MNKQYRILLHFGGLAIGILWLTLGVWAQTATPTVTPTTSGTAQFGTNWVAQFYNGTTLDQAQPLVQASYPSGINQLWGVGQPKDGSGAVLTSVPPDNFSVRFTSTQTLAAGTYTFTTTSADGVRLYINSTLVLDNFVAGTARTNNAQVPIAGGVYNISLEYFHTTGDALVQLSWTAASATAAITATPVPVATGGVGGVRGLAIRTGPYLGASMAGIARPGTTYNIAARNDSEGLFTWYLISFGDGTRQGWVSGRYFEVQNKEILPSQGSLFDTLDSAPDIGVSGATRSVMNLRVRPSERTALLAQIPWGDTVSIVGKTVQGGIDHWYHVRWNGQLGWIDASWVTARDTRNVPVR